MFEGEKGGGCVVVVFGGGGGGGGGGVVCGAIKCTVCLLSDQTETTVSHGTVCDLC